LVSLYSTIKCGSFFFVRFNIAAKEEKTKIKSRRMVNGREEKKN